MDREMDLNLTQENTDKTLERDLHTLVRFIEVYCDSWHADLPRKAPSIKECDVETLMGRPLLLCPECTRLLAHAVHKRSHCPLHPKPACKKCPNHCYHPMFRQQIRQVMKFSGRKLVMSGRLDYLWHLLF